MFFSLKIYYVYVYYYIKPKSVYACIMPLVDAYATFFLLPRYSTYFFFIFYNTFLFFVRPSKFIIFSVIIKMFVFILLLFRLLVFLHRLCGDIHTSLPLRVLLLRCYSAFFFNHICSLFMIHC